MEVKTIRPVTSPNQKDSPDFRVLFESAPGLYLVLTPDLKIVAVSDAYLRATMRHREDLLGRNIFDAFPDNPDDPSATGVRNLRASLERVLHNKVADAMAVQKYDIRKPESEGGEFEVRYWSPMNSPVTGKDGEIAYIIHRVEDVTEFVGLKHLGIEQQKLTEELRTRAEQMEAEVFLRAQEVQDANARLEETNRELEKRVAEATQAREDLDRYFMLSIDLLCVAGPDGYFKRVNPAWEKALGWKAEELLSRPYIEFVHPDDQRATVREAEYQAHGREAVAFENRYRCKDGSYRWLMWNATSVVDGLHIYAMARDVTEAKQTADALVKAKTEAERSNRFKDQFLSTMSHELRTPLNAVIGFSDLLTEQRCGPLNDRQGRYVNHIHSGGQHLLRLINDVLDISKIEAGRLQLAIENVRINHSISEAMDTLRPLVDRKSQKLSMRTTTDLSVRADSTRLRQVLINLIGNAIKFTPEGGTIELSTIQLGSTVRVDVRDSGPGIPAEEQRRIFEAFCRLQHGEKAPDGTGLGLAITTRLVELHGGYLGVESKPGDGSCFYFTLPLVPTFEPAAPESSELSSLSRPHGKILVVEDDPAAMQLLETQLTSAGYEVVLCDDPARAVAIAAEIQPDAVTLDIIMKPVSGWELLINMKANPITAHIPVVVVTVVDQASMGALFGADEYVVKPVDRPRLLSAVGRCLNKRVRTKEPSILIVEDDVPTREYIAELLSKQDYAVKTAGDGPEARARIAESMPGLVVLDLILPSVSGFQLLAEWRADPKTAGLPVVVLTNKDLTPEEKAYLRTNSSALLNKQEDWKDALLKQLRETLALVPEMKS